MPTLLREEEKTLVLEMSGELSVADASEMKRQLIEGMSSPKPFEIDASKVCELDIPVLQLLWAVMAEARKRSKKVEWRGAIAQSLENTIREAGLPDFAGRVAAGAADQPGRESR